MNRPSWATSRQGFRTNGSTQAGYRGRVGLSSSQARRTELSTTKRGGTNRIPDIAFSILILDSTPSTYYIISTCQISGTYYDVSTIYAPFANNASQCFT